MEVMIAALILAMSVAATTAIVGTARANMLREQRRWLREHLLANAVEFYLACGPDAMPPDGLLPDGYGCSCELYDVEDLPEDALESIREWRLGEYHIVVGHVEALAPQVQRIVIVHVHPLPTDEQPGAAAGFGDAEGGKIVHLPALLISLPNEL